MQKKSFATLLLGASLALVSTAYADPHGPDNRGNQGRDFRNNPGGPSQYNRGGPPSFDRNRVWHRGDRYDGPHYKPWMVNNWRQQRGLWAPPRGYYWMQYGNQFLLTAVATGVIAGVVNGDGMVQPVSPGYQPPPPPPPGYRPY